MSRVVIGPSRISVRIATLMFYTFAGIFKIIGHAEDLHNLYFLVYLLLQKVINAKHFVSLISHTGLIQIPFLQVPALC